MTGKSLNKRHKINDKESNNKYVRFLSTHSFNMASKDIKYNFNLHK